MEFKRENLSCDVLIAGGGIGGLACAASLKEQNPDLDIIILEKQTAGFGGKANKGGGVLQYFNDDVDPMAFLAMHVTSIGCYLGNQQMLLTYMKRNHEMLDKLTEWGVNVPKHDDGTYDVCPTGPYTSMVCVDLDLCLQIRRRIEKQGVRIFDKTTVTELYTKDGEIAGVAAYSILDGTFYTVQAKKVIMATGSQNYRIASMWSCGRGDGIAAAYRAGAEMRNAEFGNFAQLMRVKSHNEVVFGENYMYNAKGENITKNFRWMRETDINSNAILEWRNTMLNGEGPVHLDFKDDPAAGEDALEKLWYRPYGKKFRDLNTIAGNTVDTDLEVCPLLIGEQSPIRVEEDMQTTIPGLYAIGDCSYCGSGSPGAVPAPPGRNRGSGILNAVFTAIVCAEALAKEPLGELKEICPKCVERVYAETYETLGKTEGATAKEVIALVQKAMAPAENSVIMSAERMAAAEKLVDEAAKLAENMKSVDLHDMLACHEAKAMVLSAKMHFTAAKMRQESRGWFYREDFPKMDNENWLKWIIIKNENGEMTTRTEDIPVDKMIIKPLPGGLVPVTEEEKETELYKKWFLRDMTPAPKWRYTEVVEPVDPAIAFGAEDMNKLFDDGYLPFEKGWCILPNGCGVLANITQMPGVTPEMFDWWFAWHGVKPLRYKIWDHEDHYYCQTRNLDIALNENLSMKERYWNTVHDVKEDCNLGVENIVISFRKPTDIGFDEEKWKNFKGTIVCAGDDKSPCVMVHFLRPVEGGCELRTRFWFGYSIIGGKPVKILPDGVNWPDIPLKGLLLHNIKEFTNLAAILPDVYAEYHDKF